MVSSPPRCSSLGLTFLLVGFARPQRAISSTGRGVGPTVVLAFDVSGSMAARDIQPTRLRAARELAIRFLNKLPSSYEVAVVTFGNKVRLTVPPTFDRADVIAHLPKTVTPLSGTSIGDGISAAESLIIQAIRKVCRSIGFIRPGRSSSSRTARRPAAGRRRPTRVDRVRLRDPDQLGDRGHVCTGP